MEHFVPKVVNGSIQLTNTLKDLINKWLTEQSVDYSWSKTTYNDYEKTIKVFTNFVSNNQNSTDILREYKIFLESKINQGLLKETSANVYLTTAKIFFNWMFNSGILDRNPGAKIKLFKVNRNHKKQPLSVEELTAIFKLLSDDEDILVLRNKLIIAFGALLGLRRIEMVRANIEHLKRIGDKTVLYIQGKGHTDFDTFVKVPLSILKIINKYLSLRVYTKPSDPLLLSKHKSRLKPESVSRICKKIFKSVGIISSDITCHSLRHHFGTELVKVKDINTVRQQMRHQSINTTLIYLKELNKLNDDSTDILASNYSNL